MCQYVAMCDCLCVIAAGCWCVWVWWNLVGAGVSASLVASVGMHVCQYARSVIFK